MGDGGAQGSTTTAFLPQIRSLVLYPLSYGRVGRMLINLSFHAHPPALYDAPSPGPARPYPFYPNPSLSLYICRGRDWLLERASGPC